MVNLIAELRQDKTGEELGEHGEAEGEEEGWSDWGTAKTVIREGQKEREEERRLTKAVCQVDREEAGERWVWRNEQNWSNLTTSIENFDFQMGRILNKCIWNDEFHCS